MPIAIVLLSGGLDSATTLAIARDRGYDCLTLSFDYGQRHRFELDAAAEVAAHLGAIEHRVARLDADLFRNSALTDDIEMPRDRDSEDMESGIPVTYVPARNLVFLSMAGAWAESRGLRDLFIGVNAIDYSGYPDCRPAFVTSFTETLNLATKSGVEGERLNVHAPLIDLPKEEIIRIGIDLGLDYGLTHSCYDPDQAGGACGHCDSCLLRRQGFARAGVDDPTRYNKGAKL